MISASSKASVLHDASDAATASRLRMLSMLSTPWMDDIVVFKDTNEWKVAWAKMSGFSRRCE